MSRCPGPRCSGWSGQSGREELRDKSVFALFIKTLWCQCARQTAAQRKPRASLVASPTLFIIQKRLATRMEMRRAEFAELGNNRQLKEAEEVGNEEEGVDYFL